MRKLYRYKFGAAVFDEARPQLTVNHLQVRLAPKQRKLLSVLLGNAGKVVSRDELLDRVWGYNNFDVSPHVLTAAVDRLRNALGPEGEAIKTVHGSGYRFDGVPTREVVGGQSDATLALEPGKPVPRRPDFELDELLASSEGIEVWTAHSQRSAERRVYKFAADRDDLRHLKHEARLATVVGKALGDRRDLVKVLGAGFEEIPYFVELEYGGDNLLQWSKAPDRLAGLDLDARLKLFIGIARTIADLHSIPLIHADIKPQNILIDRADDGTWYTRVVDFGSSRLDRTELLEALQATQLSVTVAGSANTDPTRGTFMYMAPEIWQGEPASVRSDVFSLGVILFQLVVGDLTRRPDAGWQREVDDPLLVRDIGQAIDGDPARRFASVPELVGNLRDLAPRREATRLEEVRQQESARLQQLVDRARTRRPWVLASFSILALGLAAAIALAYRLDQAAREARRETSRAIEISRFLERDVIGAANPGAPHAVSDVKVKDLLVRAAAGLEARTAIDDSTRGAMHHALGRAFLGLSDYDNARHQFEEAIRLAGDPGDALGPRAGYDLVEVLTMTGHRPEARSVLAQADSQAGELPVPERPALELQSHLAKGALDYDDGKIDEAVSEALAAESLQRRIAASDDDLLFKSRLHLADAYFFQQDYVSSETAVRPLMAPEYTIDRVGAKNWGSARLSYASALQGRHEATQAERVQREVVDTFTRRLGRDHFLVGFAEECLASTLVDQDRWRDALAPARDSLRIMRIALGQDSQDARLAQANLGNVELMAGDFSAAIAELQDALGGLIALQGESDPQVQMTSFYLADALLGQGRGREALQVLDRLQRKALATAGVVEIPWEIQLQAQRGRALLEMGRRTEALPLLRSALAEMEKAGARPSQLATVRDALERAESKHRPPRHGSLAGVGSPS